MLCTRVEADLANEEPTAFKSKAAAENLCRLSSERQRDGAGRWVVHVSQGHVKDERLCPRAQKSCFKLTLHPVEHPYTLNVSVTAVHLTHTKTELLKS